MPEKIFKWLDIIGKGVLILVLTASVLVGAFLCLQRCAIELQDRTVELCVDLNDLKRAAAFEKRPIGPILDEVRKIGITSVGVMEETLPDANARGEIYYAKGVGITGMSIFNPVFRSLENKGLIKPERTYIFAPSDPVRRRIYNQLRWVLGKTGIKAMSKDVLEVDEAEENIRELGLGISEAQEKILSRKGFSIIPRVWNDERYHLGSIGQKVSALKDYDTVIFEGEEILGYPEWIGSLAGALKKYKIRYGYVEIVKQEGDGSLRKLMDREVVRVHSVPERELKKLYKDEVVRRFVRAARERKVRFFYIRPFLPPQVDAFPVAFNLDYFEKIKSGLEKAGFVIGKSVKTEPLTLKGWHVLALGIGVMIGMVFLFNHYFRVHSLWMILFVLLSAAGIIYSGMNGQTTGLQQGLALLAAIVFPTLAVVSSFSRTPRQTFFLWDATFIVLNAVAEVLIGVFLVIGLLADHRFMLGVETFKGVKLALLAPILLVALYFILKQGRGGFKDRITSFMNTDVKMIAIMAGIAALGALGIFVARSGNFVLPVPVFEKYFRNFLESVFFIRPRTKEFLVGYPFLFLAALASLRGQRKWLWLLAAVGAIAPISVMNTFCHIHTPFLISAIRTANGLILGILIGSLAMFTVDLFIKRREEMR
jgi:hypothetical protein